MDINSVKVYQKSSQNLLRRIEVDSISYDPKFEFMSIVVDENLANNNDYVVSIDYTGRISDILEGFYLSSYLDSEGKTQ
jgi:hypothetical protein